jgi:hypothetical protein
MAIPEFSGEASLYRTSVQYNTQIGISVALAESVIPQQFGRPHICREVCGPCIGGHRLCRFVGPGLCPQIIWWRPCYWDL